MDFNGLPRPASMDYNVIHNIGSVEIEHINPMRDPNMDNYFSPNITSSTLESNEEYEEVAEDNRSYQPEQRPGVYYEKPSRPSLQSTSSYQNEPYVQTLSTSQYPFNPPPPMQTFAASADEVSAYEVEEDR